MPSTVEELRSLPESGMGFQHLRAQIDNGAIEEVIVFNGELLVYPFEMTSPDLSPFEEALAAAEPLVDELIEIKGLIGAAESLERYGSMVAEGSASPALPRSRKRPANPSEGFLRFSAYRKDFRVTPEKGIVSGSYATSVNDGRGVASGLAAVGRYALPSPWPAIFVFTIVPDRRVIIDVGTVRPAFGQAGGGVEAQFLGATSPGTVCGPYTIPEV